jgi:hypothetical protein
MKGNVTNTGYWPDSPDRNNDFNIIPSNNITMEGMDMPLMGVSNKGDKKLMIPGKNYKFKGDSVMETPVDKGMFLGRFKQVGGQLVPQDTDKASFQKGGEPIYVYSKKDPAYQKYLKQKAYYDKQKAIYEMPGPGRNAMPYDDFAELSYRNATQYKEKFDPEIGVSYSHMLLPNQRAYVFRKPTPVILEEESNPKAIDIKPLPTPSPTTELKPVLQNLPRPQTNKQRVVVNTPQGDKIRVQDIKTKRFINWEDDKGLPSDVENPSGTASQDFPQMRRVAPPQGGFAYGGDISKDKGVYLGAYKQVGGQLIPHDISVPNLSRQDGGGIDYEAIKNPELAAKARAMGHNTIAEYRNSNWGYGKNKKQQANTNAAPIARVTDPAFQEELAYQEAKNKLKLRQQLESAYARNADAPNTLEFYMNGQKAQDAMNQMYQKYPNDKRLTAKENAVSTALGKFIAQQAIEKGIFKGLPLISSNDKYLDIVQALHGASNINDLFDIQDVIDAEQEGKNKYAYYTEELKDKVDAYEKAHGTYQPGLMDKVQALMPNRQDGGPAYNIPEQPYRNPKISRDSYDREYYDPMTETIHMKPSYPNVIYEAMVKDHESEHHNQKLKGRMSSTEYWPGPLKEPVIGASDDMIYPYYNRATQDVYNLMGAAPQSTLFGIPEDVAVMGFQDKTYDTPGTAEYEAENASKEPKTLYMGDPVVENAIDKTLGRQRQDPEMMFKDKYNTELTKEEQKDFDKWVAKESKQQGRDIMMDKGAYDIQGFWKSGDWKKRDADNHGTDTWKKPNHPTFSNQSKYNGAGGLYGGNWTEDAGYQPSKQSLNNYGPDYYNWMFGEEPNRPEHLDMSRYDGTNSPTPVVYKKGGSVKKVKIKSLPNNWKSQ